MGEQLKKEILVRNGILSSEEIRQKPVLTNCPRCAFLNQQENKYCSKCSYPLTAQAFEEIKVEENAKISSLEKKVEETNHRMIQIISIIQQIPSLSHIKPEALMQKEIE